MDKSYEGHISIVITQTFSLKSSIPPILNKFIQQFVELLQEGIYSNKLIKLKIETTTVGEEVI